MPQLSQLRRRPFVETRESVGKTFFFREATIGDAGRILQLCREVFVRFEIVSHDTRNSYGAGGRCHPLYQKHLLLIYTGMYTQEALKREFPLYEGSIACTKYSELTLKKHINLGIIAILHRWKMTEIELNLPTRKSKYLNGVSLAREQALAILQENASALFPDNVFQYSYLWMVNKPSSLSFAEAYNNTDTLFYFKGPDRLSGVVFFDVIFVEAGTLATAFCYTSRDSDSQLVFEMLQSVVDHLQTTAQRGKPIRLGIHVPQSCNGDKFFNRLRASGIVQKWDKGCFKDCIVAIFYPEAMQKKFNKL
ncbi:hypothetical protein CAPTEDRAFT_213025 [Capitella teleta]|uniref:Uncharacterized protein n=1 Tax=Capitella teleta TaxID=283909 RepID=R7UKI5_CAPTE|nr:hypothetical protein CAPTEDRAFT_213025 [Capitella teleta]|eukprot:ELU06578.1 hypothetical protein CAPTEDRAFT_213025 [Capitella teleta]